MRAEAAISGLVVLTVALAGCIAGDEAEANFIPNDPNDTAGDALNVTVNVTAIIGVVVDGNRTDLVNGSLNATQGQNLTFDASQSVGENLTYLWDFGDNTTSDLVEAVHAFNASGTYNVTLTVSAGNATSDATVAVSVAAAGPAPGTPAGTITETIVGRVLVPTQGASGCAVAGEEGIDINHHPFIIPETNEEGLAVEGGRLHVLLELRITNLDSDLYVFAPDGTSLGSGTSFNPTGSPSELVEAEGPLPPGEYMIEVHGCSGAYAGYDLTITADLVTV